ncbi:hypothetical protein ACFXPS_19310 [Nocardia sp. NPDC059091]|uniref:hypothetical protein n=1 Tax=unclassified Nocardia TaxID=2637762 RepID=UPI0036A78BFC
MSEPLQAPISSRRHACRLLRPHLVPLAVLAISADEAAAALAPVLFRGPRRHRMDTKMRGQLVASLWHEAVANWAAANRDPGLQLLEPYGWSELLVGNLHVHIQRDTDGRVSKRKKQHRDQVTDSQLEFELGFSRQPVTNIDVIAELTDAGRVRGVYATAPLGKSEAWGRIRVNMSDARKKLASWKIRDISHLEQTRRLHDLASFDTLHETIAKLEADLEAARKRYTVDLDPFLRRDTQQQRPSFRVPPRRAEGTGTDSE